MLVDYRQSVFSPTIACTGTDRPIDTVFAGEIQLQDREAHFGAANTDNNCHVIRMTDNSKLCCARFKSRASAVNKALEHRILGHIVSFLSTLLSLYLPLNLPPPIFHSFYFTPARPLALLTPQRGVGGESQTRVLVS